MATQGQCNCGSVSVTLPKAQDESILCYCDNCRTAGGGPCSANFLVDLSEISINDPKGAIKEYQDSNTASGNTITRRFCGTCGSPIGSITPAIPGKIFLKASLFGPIPQPGKEAFAEKKPSWAKSTVASKA